MIDPGPGITLSTGPILDTTYLLDEPSSNLDMNFHSGIKKKSSREFSGGFLLFMKKINCKQRSRATSMHEKDVFVIMEITLL